MSCDPTDPKRAVAEKYRRIVVRFGMAPSASVRYMNPMPAAMSAGEVAAAARSVEDEIGAALGRYVEDGHQIFPVYMHIVAGR